MHQKREEQKMRNIIILLILVLCVFSSKQVFLFNEEIIVALSFIGFVLFTQIAFSDTFKSVFDERQNDILANFEHFFTSKETLLKELIKHHELRSSTLYLSTQMLGKASIYDIVHHYVPKCNQTVNSVLIDQFQQKIKTLANIQQASRIQLQNTILQSFQNAVFDQFRFFEIASISIKIN
jgi:hypothetical protein